MGWQEAGEITQGAIQRSRGITPNDKGPRPRSLQPQFCDGNTSGRFFFFSRVAMSLREVSGCDTQRIKPVTVALATKGSHSGSGPWWFTQAPVVLRGVGRPPMPAVLRVWSSNLDPSESVKDFHHLRVCVRSELPFFFLVWQLNVEY